MLATATLAAARWLCGYQKWQADERAHVTFAGFGAIPAFFWGLGALAAAVALFAWWIRRERPMGKRVAMGALVLVPVLDFLPLAFGYLWPGSVGMGFLVYGPLAGALASLGLAAAER